jgi:hypothetical protein
MGSSARAPQKSQQLPVADRKETGAATSAWIRRRCAPSGVRWCAQHATTRTFHPLVRTLGGLLQWAER